ncbi:unnamed protein product [Urochloa decumbens]|uniref:FBD domain-containing protein n=1 Tax=Urochloa decumbens TaxID=240449 RepID=A0ABC9CU11_9POAL
MGRIIFSRPRKKRRADHGGAVVEASAQEGTDLISRLPDGVLGTIVGLLGTEEGARTAILSRRWRFIWRCAPINLDDRFSFLCTIRKRLHVISQILAAHRGPARRLALTAPISSSNFSRYDDWFPLPIFDTLQELVLHFPSNPDHHEMPATALRFRCLRVLDLDNCTFSASACTPSFPCLTYLSLRHVGITEELLHAMISNSPGIEHIMLDTNFGHHRLCLSLPRLRCLAVSVKCYNRVEQIELEDILIEDAPSLERLLLHEVNYGPSVRITRPTKLKMLGYLGTGFPIIQLGHSIFKAMVPVNLVDQLSSVTILALKMPEPKLKVVIGYLTCFPCLEKLHVKFLIYSWTSFKCALRWNPFVPIECLDRSLKTIVLQLYAGLRTHVEFAKFFIKRARVLEVMKFCCIGPYTTRWLQNQHRQLNINSRVSWHAKFLFVRDCDLPLRFWMDDCFSRKDPFKETR